MKKDAPPNQCVPVFVHGRLSGKQNVARFIRQSPGPLCLGAPLANRVSQSRVPLALSPGIQSPVLAPELRLHLRRDKG